MKLFEESIHLFMVKWCLMWYKPVKMPSKIISLASDLSLESGNEAKGKLAPVEKGVERWKAPHDTLGGSICQTIVPC